VLERLDPVPEPRRLLVAEALGEVREPGTQARQRAAFEQTLELRVRCRREGAGGQRRPPAAADRSQRTRLLGDHEVVASPAGGDGALTPDATQRPRAVP